MVLITKHLNLKLTNAKTKPRTRERKKKYTVIDLRIVIDIHSTQVENKIKVAYIVLIVILFRRCKLIHRLACRFTLLSSYSLFA